MGGLPSSFSSPMAGTVLLTATLSPVGLVGGWVGGSGYKIGGWVGRTGQDGFFDGKGSDSEEADVGGDLASFLQSD